MPRVSIISDLGAESHYPVQLKIRLKDTFPGLDLIEITHNIRAFDTLEAAQVLRATYAEFTDETIHLIAVDSHWHSGREVLVYRLKNQWFVTLNEKILELAFEHQEVFRYVLPMPDDIVSAKSTFTEKYYFPFVLRVLTADKPEQFLKPYQSKESIGSLHAVVEADQIRTTVVYIDPYGNAIVNVTRPVFIEAAKRRPYRVHYYQNSYLNRIYKNYHSVEEGQEFMVFNDSDYLEIGVRNGNGAQLLALKPGGSIIIEFINPDNEN